MGTITVHQAIPDDAPELAVMLDRFDGIRAIPEQVATRMLAYQSVLTTFLGEMDGQVADELQWVRDVDARNAEVIDATRGRADILVHFAATLGSPTESAFRTASSIGERQDHGNAE